MNRILKLFQLVLVAIPFVHSFPAHQSLAGLTREQLDVILPRFQVAPPENPPGPLNDTSAKLVNDADHPWIAPAPTDMRGPCPGLNTLASHGVSGLAAFYPIPTHRRRSTFLEMELPLQLRSSLRQWKVRSTKGPFAQPDSCNLIRF
jgi:hypothetical protein